MRDRAIWFVGAALLAACNCKGDENDGHPDTGTTDMAQTDMGGGTDAGGDVGGDMQMPVDMAMLPDGVSIPGLSGSVTAMFDEHGVLHLQCDVINDCYAAQGYFHAAHRFVSMDVQRRFSTGRLSALIGNAALGIDEATRALISTADGQPLEQAEWEGSSPEAQDAINAYTRGVNAWLQDMRLGRNGAVLADEYQLELIDQDAEIPDWEPTDTMATGLLLLESLSNTSDDDIQRGLDYPKLTAEQGFDLLGPMSATQQATMPASGEAFATAPALRTFPNARDMQPALDRLAPQKELLRDAQRKLAALGSMFGDRRERGSNNWVLSGTLTASGMPILANDPHLGLQNPALWYLAEINSADGIHIAGVSLPGAPGIVLGHNENIAWGATVVYMDLCDVYTEELTPDGSAVMFNGSPVPIVEVQHEFKVARGNPVTRTLRFVPHHGPVLSYDASAGEALSIRWTANDDRGVMDVFFGLFEATTVAEARTAIATSSSTNQNWIVADRNGDIGWFPFNALPTRPWASLALPPWMPLPGDGSAEWGPRWAVDALPQMVNPANGFVATANTDPLGTSFDGDPTNEVYGYIYSYGELGGFREDAILKRIATGGAAHTADISRDMQGDSFIVLRDWVRPQMQATIDANPGTLSANAAAFWATIENWDGTCPAGVDGRDPTGPKTADAATAAASIGCTAFHYAFYALKDATFEDELAPTEVEPQSGYGTRSLVVLLNDPARLQGGAVYWDDTRTAATVETQDDIILAAIEAATTTIRADLGTDSDDWRWGRVHTLLLYANLFNNAGFRQYDAGPFAAPGGTLSINVANPNDPASGDWGFSNGPSMRHVSEFGPNGITSTWTLPGGQRHFRDSPHYDDLLDDWLAANHFQMPFTTADVAAAATETVEVAPR